MNQVTRSTAIRNFLKAKTHAYLADLYYPGMEVQVLVAPDNGRKIEGEYKGRAWSAWTDNVQTWKSFRMPLNANATPESNDSVMSYDLVAHAEGIGMTGWDWTNKVSRWLGFDFDAVTGHKERHAGRLVDAELQAVEKAAQEIPWVTVLKSTSGKGLHLYVFLTPYPTENHTEHAALARAILGQMSAITGFDFRGKVDVCGGNMWVWHRKMEGTDGLTLIKQGEELTEVPVNWRDHLAVVTGKRRRTLPSFVEKNAEVQDDAERMFEELTGQQTQVKLDNEHHKLIDWLRDNGAVWSWNTDQHMLITHTIWLKEAHDALGLKGPFQTLSTGTERGVDQNVFLYPLRRGAWSCRRYTPGVAEAPTWRQDGAGWTQCYYNREPDLSTSAFSHGAVEDPAGGFMFNHAEDAKKAAFALGADIKVANYALARRTKLKPSKDGRLVVEIAHESTDNPAMMEGWLPKGKTWQRIYNVQTSAPASQELGNYDDMLRHIVTEADDDAGWVWKSDQRWRIEPLTHVKHTIQSELGLKPGEANIVVGSCVAKPWTLVNQPFQPEYTGDRTWNRNAAQLRFAPSQMDLDNLVHPTWSKILNHLGLGLDAAVKDHPWCMANGILTGADYLKIWIASLFQEPTQPLPYLFFYSREQNTGKSIYHEALSLLMTKGCVRADGALINQSGFNGELENAILCVVEEIDLRKHRGTAYNRLKDWVTSIRLPIHKKGQTPYDIPNTAHFVQTANDIEFCPIFPGDTRITMIHVQQIPEERLIPKRNLMSLLEKEASDFLAAVINLEIPVSGDRLNVPVIATEEKLSAEKANQTSLELFLSENAYHIDGVMLEISDFYDRFRDWLDPSQIQEWSKIKVGRSLPSHFPKGRRLTDAHWCYGNMSWQPRREGDSPLERLVSRNDFLMTLSEAQKRAQKGIK